MRTISRLKNKALVSLLVEAGSRKIVLVEGEEDRYILDYWYSMYLSEMLFFDCNGCDKVAELFEEAQKSTKSKRIFAIVDRDFYTQQEVEDSYKPESHFFIWQYSEIENYLMEYPALKKTIEIIRHQKHKDTKHIIHKLHNTKKVETAILNLCADLKFIIAANWLLKTNPFAKHFPIGFDYDNKEVIIRKISTELNITTAQATIKLQTQLVIIEKNLDCLKNAHKIIDGKRLLFHFNKKYFSGQDKKNELMVYIKETKLPENCNFIIELIKQK